MERHLPDETRTAPARRTTNPLKARENCLGPIPSEPSKFRRSAARAMVVIPAPARIRTSGRSLFDQ
jgi:hypothetical protein